MVLEALLKIIFGIIGGLIDLIPPLPTGFTLDLSGFAPILKGIFVLIPYQLFTFAIGNIVFWIGLDILWAFVEWVYKKIPGVS